MCLRTYTLEHLLSLDIVESRVEVLDPAGNILNLVFVGALELAGLADGEVEVETDAAVRVVNAEPAAAAGGGAGGEAELVVAGIGGSEDEAARLRSTLGHDAVVVVEDFLQEEGDVSSLTQKRTEMAKFLHEKVGLEGQATRR